MALADVGSNFRIDSEGPIRRSAALVICPGSRAAAFAVFRIADFDLLSRAGEFRTAALERFRKRGFGHVQNCRTERCRQKPKCRLHHKRRSLSTAPPLDRRANSLDLNLTEQLYGALAELCH